MLENDIRSIRLDLTNNCNQKCIFCSYHSNNQKITLKELNFKIYKKLLLDCLKLPIIPIIKLSGSGEPTLYNSFHKFIVFAHKQKFKIRLITNGLSLNKNAKLLANKLDCIIISIHGTENTHDKIVCVNGAYNSILKGVTKIQKINPSIKIIFNIVINKYNYKELHKIVKIAKKFKVIPRIQHLKMININLIPDDLNILLYEIKKCKSISKNLIMEPDMTDIEIYKYYDLNNKFILNSKSCWRIKYDLPIQINGDAVSCNNIYYGNIINTSLKDIIYSKNRIKFINYIENKGKIRGLPNYCSRCCYNTKKIVKLYSNFK